MSFIIEVPKAEQSKGRILITGPSGFGKTTSAVLLAAGMADVTGEDILLVDTEEGSGKLRSVIELAEYQYGRISAPFHPSKYIEALQAAEDNGFGIVILDSITHEWGGSGGILDMADKEGERVKNQFQKWVRPKREHKRFLEAILQSKCHVICTARSKTDKTQTDNKGDRMAAKFGLMPVQESDLEYEFTVAFDIYADSHTCAASKDRTSLFDQKDFIISRDTGRELAEWLCSGAKPRETDKDWGARMMKQAEEKGLSVDDLRFIVKARGFESSSGLTDEQRAMVEEDLEQAEPAKEGDE